MNEALLEQYNLVVSQNQLYIRNRDQYQYLLESYMGGIEWRRGLHLTKYINETANEYSARLTSTHLENHCKSVISTYVSFLFREKPHREYGSLEYDPALESFLEDADMDGRSLDAFIKEVAIWSSVFGACWVMCVKPNVGAMTLGDELAADVRPYVNLITPLTVTDWNWQRLPNGRYELDYFKYIEEGNDTTSCIKEWTRTEIHTWVVNHQTRQVTEHTIEPNQLMAIPAVICYNHKSPVRGVGVSDITDIADAQKTIYNLTSEMEQSIRINGHPTMVKTVDVEMSAGAGSIAIMPENLDPGLKPYAISVNTDISAIFTAINHATDAIDKMANTGSIRSTESRRMSGVAQEQEFQLLNAKLSEKADNLELCEEGIWQWFAYYQGKNWDGEIKYPGSFAIRDTHNDIEALVRAKQAATDPRVLQVIDHELLELLGEDADMIREEVDPSLVPAQPPFDIHVMINPATGEEFYARTEAEHLRYAELGYVHKEES